MRTINETTYKRVILTGMAFRRRFTTHDPRNTPTRRRARNLPRRRQGFPTQWVCEIEVRTTD
jgi:hypothetical protein